MSSDLTPRQAEILDFVKAEIERCMRPPSLQEIARRFAITAPSASQHLRAIEAKGQLQRVRGQRRSFLLPQGTEGVPSGALPVIGRIAAGRPLLAIEHFEQELRIDPELFHPRAHFMLKVQGESMRDLGIQSGDFVAIHAQDTADDGQIVAALLTDGMTADYEVTLKRIRVESNRILLLSENRTAGVAPIEVPVGEDGQPALRIAGIYCGHIHPGPGRTTAR